MMIFPWEFLYTLDHSNFKTLTWLFCLATQLRFTPKKASASIWEIGSFFHKTQELKSVASVHSKATSVKQR